MEIPAFLWEEETVELRLRRYVSAQAQAEIDVSGVPASTLMQLFGEEAREYASSLFAVDSFTAEEWDVFVDQMTARISIRAMDPAFMQVRTRTIGGTSHGVYAQEKQNELREHFGETLSAYRLERIAAWIERGYYATTYLFHDGLKPHPASLEFDEKSQTVARYYMWMLYMFTTHGRIPNQFYEAERQGSLNMTSLYQQTKTKVWEKLPQKAGDW